MSVWGRGSVVAVSACMSAIRELSYLVARDPY